MILEALDDHGRPVVLKLSRVLVRDEATRTPLLVAAEFAERGVMAATAADPDFVKLLQILRINDSVLVTQLGRNDICIPEIR